MKNRIVIALSILFAATLILSCSKSIEKKIAGTWKVEDVKFDTNMPIDQAKLDASKESAKAVSYELLEDNSAKIHVGKTVLEGTWSYKAAEAGIYMAFKGSTDTVLLGKLEDQKLVNIANRPQMVITTIFTKAD
jgi:hypothetical protein